MALAVGWMIAGEILWRTLLSGRRASGEVKRAARDDDERGSDFSGAIRYRAKDCYRYCAIPRSSLASSCFVGAAVTFG
ncbi:MAG: hypothetical protein R3D29_15880 [Nitratireductor sp.]